MAYTPYYTPSYQAPFYGAPAPVNAGLPAGAYNYTPQQANANTGVSAANSSGFIWVSGEAGAKVYLVAPSQTVLLMDSEAPKFYLKSCDSAGMPLPLRTFKYEEQAAANNPLEQTQQQDSTAKSIPELGDVKNQLGELENKLNMVLDAVNSYGAKISAVKPQTVKAAKE